MAATRKVTGRTTTERGADGAFTAEELAAMKEHAAEVKASRRRSGKAGKEEEARAVVEKIAAMDDADRVIAERLHELITTAAPELDPKLWYGMPAYYQDGKCVCFFQDAKKFKSRYVTLGFQDAANLDDGAMWPTSYALTKLTEDAEQRVIELVQRAVS